VTALFGPSLLRRARFCLGFGEDCVIGGVLRTVAESAPHPGLGEINNCETIFWHYAH
jgi:hypothetical protein